MQDTNGNDNSRTIVAETEDSIQRIWRDFNNKTKQEQLDYVNRHQSYSRTTWSRISARAQQRLNLDRVQLTSAYGNYAAAKLSKHVFGGLDTIRPCRITCDRWDEDRGHWRMRLQVRHDNVTWMNLCGCILVPVDNSALAIKFVNRDMRNSVLPALFGLERMLRIIEDSLLRLQVSTLVNRLNASQQRVATLHNAVYMLSHHVQYPVRLLATGAVTRNQSIDPAAANQTTTGSTDKATQQLREQVHCLTANLTRCMNEAVAWKQLVSKLCLLGEFLDSPASEWHGLCLIVCLLYPSLFLSLMDLLLFIGYVSVSCFGQ